MNRRNFIENTSLLAAGLLPLQTDYSNSLFPFSAGSKILNFDTAAAGIPADEILSSQERWDHEINSSSPYQVWNNNQPILEKIRKRTAYLIGVNEEEVAFCRNTTEGLDTIVRGIDIKSGETIVYSNYDYPYLQSSIEQIKIRNNVKTSMINIDIANLSDNDIIEAYTRSINESTRLLVLTHIFNWNGRILPVQDIIKAARKFNTEVLIDGAHSFGQINFSLKNLDPDYFVAPYHKWFRGSLGTAFMQIKKARIKEIWPLHGYIDRDSNHITKFEHLSTVDFPGFLSNEKRFGIFNQGFIREQSEIRMNLRKIIEKELGRIDNIKLMAPGHKQLSNGILAFQLLKGDPEDFVKRMWVKHNIILKPIKYRTLNGFRISIPENTNEKNLTKLTQAIKDELS